VTGGKYLAVERGMLQGREVPLYINQRFHSFVTMSVAQLIDSAEGGKLVIRRKDKRAMRVIFEATDESRLFALLRRR